MINMPCASLRAKYSTVTLIVQGRLMPANSPDACTSSGDSYNFICDSDTCGQRTIDGQNYDITSEGRDNTFAYSWFDLGLGYCLKLPSDVESALKLSSDTASAVLS